MTAAFRLNLTALSLLALVVGMFLIYNTVSFSVVQRRPVLGILRALGVTRRELFVMILTEAAYLGLIGTALGLVLGVLMGRGAVQAVTRTINDLFFVVAVRNAEVPVWTLAKGGLIGIGAALLAALAPAYEATSVPPAGALQRSDVEEKARRALPRLTAAGGALCLLGAGMLVPEWNLAVAFVGLFAVILGAALLTPALTLLLMDLLHRLLSRRLGILTRMAPRNIIRSLSRTAVAIAALMVAVSVIIGVGVMIVSFRLTVEQWLDEILQADIFVSAPALGPNRNEATLEPSLLEELAAFPAIVDSSTSREVSVSVTMPDGRQADVQLAAVLRDLAGADRRYRAAVGDTDATWAAVEGGGVVINETMANRFDLEVGQTLEILTDAGVQSFPIAGITYDFDVNPTLLIDDGSYRRHWNDRYLTTVCAFRRAGRGRGRDGQRAAPRLRGQGRASDQLQPGCEDECARGVRPHFCDNGGSAPAGDAGGVRRHPQHVAEPAAGAGARARRSAGDRDDKAAAVGADAAGDGPDRDKRGAGGVADRFHPGADPGLHHQPALIRLDADDAGAGGRVYAGVPGGAGGCVAGRALSGLAHGPDRSG